MTDYKQATELKILNQLVRKIHNQQVIDAYPISLDGQNSEQGIAVLQQHLKIYSTDTLIVIIVKMLAFYLGCGRLVTSSTIPVDFAVKAMALRPQLCIVYHPLRRDRLKGGKLRGNYQSTIPHYNGDLNPVLPIYTLGQFTCTYKLTDNSYIMVNAKSEAEATKVCILLANYTKVKMRPPGEIKEHLKLTKRSGKQIDNIMLKPHRVDYYEGRGKGYRPIWSLNTKGNKLDNLEGES
jgi:hypothetical protein